MAVGHGHLAQVRWSLRGKMKKSVMIGVGIAIVALVFLAYFWFFNSSSVSVNTALSGNFYASAWSVTPDEIKISVKNGAGYSVTIDPGDFVINGKESNQGVVCTNAALIQIVYKEEAEITLDCVPSLNGDSFSGDIIINYKKSGSFLEQTSTGTITSQIQGIGQGGQQQGAVCGNNVRETGEDCDGYDLGGLSCASLGYINGTLSCNGSCTYNPNLCNNQTGAGEGNQINLTSEICSDGIDNNNNIAIDDDEDDCYTLGLIYYVSNAGNDVWSGKAPTWNGSDGPKQNIPAAQALITALPAGGKILFKRGDTWAISTFFGFSNGNGVANNPVTVGAYGTGNRPIFNTNGGLVIGSPNPTQYFVLDGLNLVGTGMSVSTSTGLFLWHSSSLPHHVTITDIAVEGYQTGIVNYANNFLLEDSIIRNNRHMGIFTQGIDVTIRDNLFEHNSERVEPPNFFIHTFYVSQVQNGLIEGNTIRDTVDGIKLRRGNNVTVRNNTIHDSDVAGIHGGGDSDGPASNHVFERNLIYDVRDCITVQGESGTGGAINFIIRNNICHSKKSGAVSGGNYPGMINVAGSAVVNGLYIYNNILYNIGIDNGIAISYSSAPQNLELRNNIIHKDDAGGSSKALIATGLQGITLSNNLYFLTNGVPLIQSGSTTYASLAAFAAAFPGQESGSLEADPSWISPPSNFHLQSGSPAIDAGFNVGLTVPNDFDGVSRPQGAGYDIGPYEP